MTTKQSKSSKPSNFIVMTLAVIGDGGKLSDTLTGTGKAYSTMRGFNYTGKRMEEQSNPSMFFKVKAYSKDDTVSPLVQQIGDLVGPNKEETPPTPGDKVTVKGRFGFNQWEANGVQMESLDIIASGAEAYDPKDKEARPSNLVVLTLKMFSKVEDKVMSFTKDGKPMVKFRARLSMGKDHNGDYRPAFWCNVVHSSKTESEDDVIKTAIALKDEFDKDASLPEDERKGVYFTVKGPLKREEWTTKDDDGNDIHHHGYTIWANSIEPFHWDDKDADPAGQEQEEPFDYLEGEPA